MKGFDLTPLGLSVYIMCTANTYVILLGVRSLQRENIETEDKWNGNVNEKGRSEWAGT